MGFQRCALPGCWRWLRCTTVCFRGRDVKLRALTALLGSFPTIFFLEKCVFLRSVNVSALSALLAKVAGLWKVCLAQGCAFEEEEETCPGLPIPLCP